MEERKTYRVCRAVEAVAIDADWDKPVWGRAVEGSIGLHMGPRPEHFPPTRFRVLYDDRNIYVIFKVEDRYVRAAGKRDEARVWEDSCVEFFFTPGEDLSAGYFNFETNCLGARLWHFHPDRPTDRPLDPADLARVELAHSLSDFEGELAGPLTWTVEYRVPLAVLGRYTRVAAPGAGVRWRANFQKCADRSSHPHYLTWSPIARSQPDFHVPEWFGVLEFE